MFACIHIPNFPVAAALRAEPELRAHAVAILEGNPPLEKIIAGNEKAAGMGIAPGMTKAQAELCAGLALRPRSPLQESSAHAALLDCAQSFSPCVEDTACDTVLLDLAGMESLLGSLPEISLAISHRATALGLDAHVAVASNPNAALIAARGFPSVTVIPATQEAEQLGPLPLDVLFAGKFEIGCSTLRDFRRVGSTSSEDHQQDENAASNLLETLDRWGIRNLRALAALPEIALSERLGQQGLHLQQLARGAASRTLVPVEVPLVFEEAIELEHPIVLLEPLAFLMNRLLEQISARLAARALATQELRLTLELSNLTGIGDECDNIGIPSESDGTDESNQSMLGHGQQSKWGAPLLADFARSGKRNVAPLPHRRPTKFSRALNLPLPMLDAKLFLKLLQLDLQAHPPGAPIVKIHLAAEPAHPRSAQGGLFVPPSPEPEKLELTLARIAGMVGEQRVGAVEMLDTHHPEGFRMRRFVTDSASVARAPSPAKVAHRNFSKEESPVTALRRFRPPLHANVTLENGQPIRVACLKKKDVCGEVLWKAGPWRFSGDWWEREAWSRDEWDIALQSAGHISLYRLVHDLLEGRWYVEGTYD